MTFAETYWASKHPEVRKLNTLPRDSQERETAAISLARAGHLIDYLIDMCGTDPHETMRLRKLMGYTWVPSLLQQPIKLTPGIEFPGIPAYDPAEYPTGSIRVSLDPLDYPAFDPPVIAPPAIVPKPIGHRIGSTRYFDCNDTTSPDGTMIDQDGKRYRKGTTVSPFGTLHWAEEVLS